jgi:hypothetical protein
MTLATMTMQTARDALRDLDCRWGGAYLISGAGAHWNATRRDNGRLLVASTPGGLRDLIVADYVAHPVPGDAYAEKDKP